MLQEKGVAQTVQQPADMGHLVEVVGVGCPSPGIEVKILGRNWRELPDGQIGEVALKTPSSMRGYLEDNRATRQKLRGT